MHQVQKRLMEVICSGHVHRIPVGFKTISTCFPTDLCLSPYQKHRDKLMPEAPKLSIQFYQRPARAMIKCLRFREAP